MKSVGEVRIRNRPVGHYLLSILSLGLRGVDEIRLKSSGSLIGKASDIANLLTRNLLVDTFQINFDNAVDEVDVPSLPGEERRCKTSTQVISIEFIRPIAPLVERIATHANSNGSFLSQVNIFELELMLCMLSKYGAGTLQLGIENIDFQGTITPFDLELAKLDLAKQCATTVYLLDSLLYHLETSSTPLIG